MSIMSFVEQIRAKFVERKVSPRVSRPWSNDEVETLLKEFDAASLELLQTHQRLFNIEAQVGYSATDTGTAFRMIDGTTRTLQEITAARDAELAVLRKRIAGVEAQAGGMLTADGRAFHIDGTTRTLQEVATARREKFIRCVAELRELCDDKREKFDYVLVKHGL